MLKLNPREFNSFMTETSLKYCRKKSWEKSESLRCVRRPKKVADGFVGRSLKEKEFLDYSDLEAYEIDDNIRRSSLRSML